MLNVSLFDKLRFTGDIRIDPGNTPADLPSRIIEALTHQSLPVSAGLTPDIEKSLLRVLDRLSAVDIKVNAFVYDSTDLQALCIGVREGECIVRISSRLVELLGPEEFDFVLGHEIGHYLLGHTVSEHRTGPPDLQQMMLSRAREISADRIGLLSCKSLESAIKAMIKIISGLSEGHLTFQVDHFIRQLESLDNGLSDFGILHTHPPVLIRCRALLWFSLTDILHVSLSDFSVDQLEPVDRRIGADIRKYVEGSLKERINKERDNLGIWIFASLLMKEGRFTTDYQQTFRKLFGDQKLESLKNFLSGVSIEDSRRLVDERLDASRIALREFIGDEANQYEQETNNRIEILLSQQKSASH